MLYLNLGGKKSYSVQNMISTSEILDSHVKQLFIFQFFTVAINPVIKIEKEKITTTDPL